MPRGTAFRSKAQSACLVAFEVAAVPTLDSCQQSARDALLPPSFGNRPFTIPVDSARRCICICPDWRRKPDAGRSP
jgi:hypothetical protein